MDEAAARALVELTSDIIMVFGRMKRAAETAGAAPVHRGTEFAILDTILQHGLRTVPEIAAWRGVKRQSVQALVNKLAAEGTLAFAANPGHRRSNFVIVTEKGRKTYESVRRNLVSRYSAFAGDLGPADIEAARTAVAALAEIFQAPPARSGEAGAEPALTSDRGTLRRPDRPPSSPRGLPSA
jgi:DNA-binding MarR family transcriptional regulator